MSDSDHSRDATPPLSAQKAFDAMRRFLEAYWERGERTSDDLAVLLGSLSCEATRDGRPLDAAQWSDWLRAVGEVERARRQ